MIIHRNYMGLSMKNKRNDKDRNDKLTDWYAEVLECVSEVHV